MDPCAWTCWSRYVPPSPSVSLLSSFPHTPAHEFISSGALRISAAVASSGNLIRQSRSWVELVLKSLSVSGAVHPGGLVLRSKRAFEVLKTLEGRGSSCHQAGSDLLIGFSHLREFQWFLLLCLLLKENRGMGLKGKHLDLYNLKIYLIGCRFPLLSCYSPLNSMLLLFPDTVEETFL